MGIYQQANKPLTQQMLFNWHQMLSNSRQDLEDIGRYRRHKGPMQIVSGRLDRPTLHFEAPPSNRLAVEMNAFMAWWQATAPKAPGALPALTRAAIAHLYFVCIHPFEDGNGRISRALGEKALAECQGKPTLIALSQVIEKNRKAYYQALAENNRNNEITAWISYFAETILEAQRYSLKLIDFLIAKTNLYQKLKGQLNARQEKVLTRLFREGIDGFKGGLSAKNYISLTGASRATCTRDLQDLLDKGALTKTGERKSTRYYLNLVS